MDFSTEPYVKIYSRETPTARYWGFWGVVLMEQLVKKANRAGVVALPQALVEEGDLAAAIAGVIGCGQDSVEWVRKYLPPLLEHGALREAIGPDEETTYLVLTRYHEAQFGGMDTKFSKRWSAQKLKDTEEAVALGIIDQPVAVGKVG